MFSLSKRLAAVQYGLSNAAITEDILILADKLKKGLTMTTILTLILFFSLNNNPPGTIKVKDYYVDKTEILNIHWLEFLHYKREELDSLEMSSLLPDSSNTWYKKSENFFKPIVLISYEQAVAYCEWRSKEVSEFTKRKVTYRLPTPEEWREIAEEQLENDRKGINKELQQTMKEMQQEASPYKMVERKKVKGRIYDLFSNVSEMTQQKSVAMGANNSQLTGLEKNLERVITYQAPSAYLGFRCIAEVE